MAIQSPLGNRATSILDFIGNAFGMKDEEEERQVAQPPMMSPANPDVTALMSPGSFADKLDARSVAPGGLSPAERETQMARQMSPMPQRQPMMADQLEKTAQLRAADQLTREAAAGGDQNPKFMDKVKNYFGDEGNMLRLAMAFNTMRMNPDQQLAAYAAKRLETISAQKRNQQIAPLLAQDPKLQALVASGAITAKDALGLMYKNPTQLQQMMKLFDEDPAKFKELAKSGAFGGTVDAGQGKWMDEQAKSVVQRSDAIREAGMNSRNYMNQIARFESKLTEANTGPYEQRMQALREFGASIGMDVNDVKLSEGQSLNAAAFDMVAQQLRMNKGPQTDFDAEFTSRFLPSLGNTPEANRQIIEYLKSVNILQGIYGTMVTQLDEDFGSARSQVANVENLSMNTPAVAKIGGEWTQFSEYFEIGKAQGMSPEDILDEWRKDTGAM